MSKYQAYSEYKESGVEWLGMLPNHWFSTSVKYGYEIKLGKMLQNDAKNSEDERKPYLKAVNIQQSGVDVEKIEKMWFSQAEKESLRLQHGDVLISEGGDVGRAALWKDELPECYIQNAINRGRPKYNHSSKFLYYWMVMLKSSEYIGILCNKATIAHYTVEKVENSPLFLPSEVECDLIASFLDHETAKIDTLIEKQQQLIKLLKEKRQAVISHAVTKGLNPDAPMKDSGVEWLGEVPEHWEVIRGKNVFSLTSGYAFKSEFFQKNGEGKKVLITPGSFNELGELYFTRKSTVKYEGPWDDVFELALGDMVMVLTDLSYKKLILGRVAFVERNDALLNQRISKVTPIEKKVDVNYLWRCCNSEVIREQIKITATGATVFHTSPEKVGSCWMAIPPKREQDEISIYLDGQWKKLEALVDKAGRTIKLLKERRTALISAAVTGKIDVRNWQPESQLCTEAS